MKILMVLLLIVGGFILGTGISSWVNAVNNTNAVGVFVGLSFGISFTIIGGVILVIDLLILIIYLVRRQKKKA